MNPQVREGLERATTFTAIREAAFRAARGKPKKGETARFLVDLEREVLALQAALRAPVDSPGSWRPGRERLLHIRDPKPRDITVVSFRDRVVHHVLMDAVLPELERCAIFDSYACREGKGQRAAVLRARHFARLHPWAWKVDIASYFASIPLDLLLGRLRARLRDEPMAARIERAARGGTQPDRLCGLPIGSLVSQLLANFNLGLLDHWIKDDMGWKGYLRYMDDFVLFGERDALLTVQPGVETFLADRLCLRVNPESTFLCPVEQGVPWLGLRVRPGSIRLQREAAQRYRRKLSRIDAAVSSGDMPQDEGARRARGLLAGFETYDTLQLRRSWVSRLDGGWDRARDGLRPGQPRGFLEEHPGQDAGRQPGQEAPLQPGRQPGLSSPELHFSTHKGVSGPDGGGSRASVLCPGVDLRPVPGLRVGRDAAAESTPPGGGPRVASGPRWIRP